MTTMQALVYVHMLIQLTPLGALLANQHWALIHEGLHHRLPQWQLHTLCFLFGSPADALQRYHRKHHVLNRIAERVDELPAPLYYLQLCGGLYVLELLLCLTVWYGPLILLLQAGLIYVWGWWYVAALIVRAVLISVTDYVYHYGSPTNDVLQGYDLDVGKWGQRYLLGFNLHGAHHRNPSIPGDALRITKYTGRLWPALLAQFKGPSGA